jgi:purine nucleosidase
MRVLLDTDPGSDIDDAAAIAYLCRQPRCELMGITTVSGDTATRAAVAQVVCDAAGRRDVPIHAGLAGPLFPGPGQPNVPHHAAIASRPQRRYAAGAAVDFLRQTIRDHPGEITLLSIGPMTNLAVLLALDPQIPSLLAGFVSMAGWFDPSASWSEWNLRVDPAAAAIVYAARVPGHLSIGLDVTTRCQMHRDAVRQRFTRPPLDVVAEMAEVWFAHAEQLTFHDPLAAAVLFAPDLCGYERGTVSIELHAEPSKTGLSRFSPDPLGPHRVARTVDVPRFFDEYFARLG